MAENKKIQEQQITLNPTGVKIIEQEDGKGKQLEVTLIESGWSKNGNYYSKEVAESVADHILESKKLYMDHDLTMSGQPRSLKEVVAIAVEAYKEDGRAKAIVEMTENPNTIWLYELAKQFPQEVGLSIDARARVKEGEMEGKTGRIIEDIVKLNSVDFVTTPSAGGEVTRIAASVEFEKVLNDLKSTAERLNSVNEDNKNKEINNMAEEKVVKTETLTLESLQSNHGDIVEALKSKWAKDSEEAKKVGELQGQVDDLTSKLSEAEGNNKDLEAEVDKYKLIEAEREKKDKVKTLLASSDLSSSQVSEVFENTLMSLDGEEEIKQHIQDRVNIVNSVSGVVEGNGERKTDVIEDEVATEEKSEEAKSTWDGDSFVNSIKRSK